MADDPSDLATMIHQPFGNRMLNVLKVAPGYFDALRLLAILQVQKGCFVEAIDRQQSALRRQPARPPPVP